MTRYENSTLKRVGVYVSLQSEQSQGKMMSQKYAAATLEVEARMLLLFRAVHDQDATPGAARPL